MQRRISDATATTVESQRPRKAQATMAQKMRLVEKLAEARQIFFSGSPEGEEAWDRLVEELNSMDAPINKKNKKEWKKIYNNLANYVKTCERKKFYEKKGQSPPDLHKIILKIERNKIFGQDIEGGESRTPDSLRAGTFRKSKMKVLQAMQAAADKPASFSPIKHFDGARKSTDVPTSISYNPQNLPESIGDLGDVVDHGNNRRASLSVVDSPKYSPTTRPLGSTTKNVVVPLINKSTRNPLICSQTVGNAKYMREANKEDMPKDAEIPALSLKENIRVPPGTFHNEIYWPLTCREMELLEEKRKNKESIRVLEEKIQHLEADSGYYKQQITQLQEIIRNFSIK